MDEQYTPKIGDNVVIGPGFLKPGEKVIVYTVTRLNPKTLTLAPLSGVGTGVRIPSFGVRPATGAQVSAAAALDPAAEIVIGSVVTVSSRTGQLFVVVGETARGFTLADLDGDGTTRLKAHASLLRKVRIDTAAILNAAG